jgi:hypothetical protein
VPTLFAEDKEAALQALTSEAGRPGFDVSRINRSFLMAEFINLKEAINLIASPREGCSSTPYKRTSKGGKKIGNTPKKHRPNSSATDTGTQKINCLKRNF